MWLFVAILPPRSLGFMLMLVVDDCLLVVIGNKCIFLFLEEEREKLNPSQVLLFFPSSLRPVETTHVLLH